MGYESSAEWAQAEFGSADCVDPRWQRRLVAVAAQAARRPAGKVSEVCRSSAERQGAYGLLESLAVTPAQVGSAMFRGCAARCASEPYVLCAVDGSSISLTDHARSKDFGVVGARKLGTRGLKMINALAMSPQGVPLGLSAQVWWARSKHRARKHQSQLKTEQKETRHWIEAMEQTRQVMSAHAPGILVWFQSDRETDAWPILEQADKDGHWFTVRGNHNRRVRLPDGQKSYLRPLLGQQPVRCSYSLQVTAGPHRRARIATMRIRACTATLDFRDKRTKRHFAKEVNAVLASEQGTTPTGEKPIEWLLLTNRPIHNEMHLQQIVSAYAQRWRVEDFHRTWKTGTCRVEDSQLHTTAAVIKWAMILATVAVRVERLKLLSRREPERPATDEFSAVELRAITLLRFGKKAKLLLPDGVVPTIAQATLWVAEIGGYTGKSSGGPPGSVTLTRGLREVQVAVRALDAMEGSSD